MPTFKDMTGQVFNRITVLRRVGSNSWGNAVWLCRCSCDGKELELLGGDLRSGGTVSCGCLRRERMMAGENHPAIIHGHNPRLKKSPTYTSWAAVIARCTSQNATEYANYGGAGIAVCERWLDFKNFLTDMGERPEGTTIGRFGDIGNYEMDNCAWQTKKEQVAEQKMKRQLQLVAA